MKRIITVKEGDTVPDGARYLHTSEEIEERNVRYEWHPSPGIRGMIPIFGMETQYKIYDRVKVITHHYEIDDKPTMGHMCVYDNFYCHGPCVVCGKFKGER